MTAQPIMDADGLQVVENGMPLFGEATVYGAGAVTIVSTPAWGLGYFGMPQVLVRFMSARHSEDIKKSRIIATVWVVVSLASCACASASSAAQRCPPNSAASAAESIFVCLAQIILPSFVCGLVVSGIFAATMSSSSYLCSSPVGYHCREPLPRLINRDATDVRSMFVSRITLTVSRHFRNHYRHRPEFRYLPSCFVRVGWFSASFGPLMLLSSIGVARIGRARSRGHAVRAHQPLSWNLW